MLLEQLETTAKTLENMILFGTGIFVYIQGHKQVGKTTLMKYLKDCFDGALIDSNMYFISSSTGAKNAKTFYDFILNGLRLQQDHDGTGCLQFLSVLETLDEQRVLLLDDAHVLPTNILNILSTLSSKTKLCVVMSGLMPWSALKTSSQPPLIITLKPWTRQQTMAILHANKPEIFTDANMYASISDYVYESMYISCKLVSEISRCVNMIYQQCHKAVIEGDLDPSNPRQLLQFIQPYLKSSLPKLYTRHMNASTAINPSSLSVHAKYLIIASFLASFNSTKADLKFFANNTQRKRNKGRKNYHRSEVNLNVGPKPFTAERLLAIFFNIWSRSSGTGEEDDLVPSIDLYSLLNSLISAGYLTRVSGTLEKTVLNGLRCKCNLTTDVVQTICENVGFRLCDYLL